VPIFISYSHVDKPFVNKLAAHLVKNNAHVWVDSWELNVGDSILGRVQQAIHESGALLIVLSKASVASEWCKKELNAGLMRELDEKRVVVLPVLVEDCEIPVFLREKMYADFRTSFDVALKALVEAIAKVTNIDQGRLLSGNVQIDWAETWGYGDDQFQMEYTLIESSPAFPFTLLTEVSLQCNEVATKRYQEYDKENLGWVGRASITEALADFAAKQKIKMILKDQHPEVARYQLADPAVKAAYDITIRCRRMGEDNGKDQLVNITNYIQKIAEHVRKTSRKMTPAELERTLNILADR
jgi:hypothetical protein